MGMEAGILTAIQAGRTVCSVSSNNLWGLCADVFQNNIEKGVGIQSDCVFR